VFPLVFIGLQEFWLADISLQVVKGQHCVLAGIQASQAKVPELVGSVSPIEVVPVPALRVGNIYNRGACDRLALAVYNCPLNCCSICADYYVQRCSDVDGESGIGDVSAIKAH